MQLFGLDTPSSRSRFSGSVSTPAYSLSASGGGDDGSLDFGTSLERTGATLPQQAFDARFPTEMADIDKLRGIMAPGLSAVRDARLRGIAKAKSEEAGTLRSDLSRRRLLGSSFGTMIEQDLKSRYDAASADAEAQSFIDEFTYTMQLIDKESGLINQGLQRELQELQLQTQFGTQIAQIVARNAEFAQQLAFDAASANAGLVSGIAGQLLGPVFSRAGTMGAEAILPGMTNAERSTQSLISTLGTRQWGQPRNPYVWDPSETMGGP